VTSPPYWGLRDYSSEGQIGLEQTPDLYVSALVGILGEVRRVLRDDGTLWLNIGDSYASSPPGNKTQGVSAKSGLHGVNGASGKYRETLSQSVQTKRSTICAGLKPKDLVGIPWRVAFALQANGWYLRSDIIWAKPNPMPESVEDRPTRSHEYIFLLSKSANYFYDHEAIKEPSVAGHSSGNGFKRDARLSYQDSNGARGSDEEWKPKGRGGANAFRGQGHFRESDSGPANREGRDMRDVGCGDNRNKRDVWTVNTEPFPEAHFAVFPPALITPCVLAGCQKCGTVLDPFSGAGTTALVAKGNGCRAIGIELNQEYLEMSVRRLSQEVFDFAAAGDQNNS